MINPRRIAALIAEDVDEYLDLEDEDQFKGEFDGECFTCHQTVPYYSELHINCRDCDNESHFSCAVQTQDDLRLYESSKEAILSSGWYFQRHRWTNHAADRYYDHLLCPECVQRTLNNSNHPEWAKFVKLKSIHESYEGLEDADEFGGLQHAKDILFGEIWESLPERVRYWGNADDIISSIVDPLENPSECDPTTAAQKVIDAFYEHGYDIGIFDADGNEISEGYEGLEDEDEFVSPDRQVYPIIIDRDFVEVFSGWYTGQADPLYAVLSQANRAISRHRQWTGDPTGGDDWPKDMLLTADQADAIVDTYQAMKHGSNFQHNDNVTPHDLEVAEKYVRQLGRDNLTESYEDLEDNDQFDEAEPGIAITTYGPVEVGLPSIPLSPYPPIELSVDVYHEVDDRDIIHTDVLIDKLLLHDFNEEKLAKFRDQIKQYYPDEIQKAAAVNPNDLYQTLWDAIWSICAQCGNYETVVEEGIEYDDLEDDDSFGEEEKEQARDEVEVMNTLGHTPDSLGIPLDLQDNGIELSGGYTAYYEDGQWVFYESYEGLEDQDQFRAPGTPTYTVWVGKYNPIAEGEFDNRTEAIHHASIIADQTGKPVVITYEGVPIWRSFWRNTDTLREFDEYGNLEDSDQFTGIGAGWIVSYKDSTGRPLQDRSYTNQEDAIERAEIVARFTGARVTVSHGYGAIIWDSATDMVVEPYEPSDMDPAPFRW